MEYVVDARDLDRRDDEIAELTADRDRLAALNAELVEALCRLCNELEMPGERGVLHGVPGAVSAARALIAKARDAG